MRCLACGGEMHLIEAAQDETMMVPGYEQHTFECSGCQDHVRRLVFTREIALAGLMITWGDGPKGPMGYQGPQGPKGPTGDLHRAMR